MNVIKSSRSKNWVFYWFLKIIVKYHFISMFFIVEKSIEFLMFDEVVIEKM